MSHDVHWYTAAPLWSKRLGDGGSDRFLEPALLRFKTDDFMDALQSTFATGEAADVESQLAVAETYRDGDRPADATAPMPLYQPAHQRYYLVTASLVCRERGLPDRRVDTTTEERTSFVLRRLERDDQGVVRGEYGWFGDEWRPVDGDDPHVDAAEERLPMFPQTFVPNAPIDRLRTPRRVWAGLVPVAKRETYEAAPIREVRDKADRAVPRDATDPGSAAAGLGDPRLTQFDAQVVQALTALQTAIKEDATATVSAADVQAPFVYALLDFYEFLDAYASDGAAWVQNPNRPDPEGTLLEQLAQRFTVRLQRPETGEVEPVGTWADALAVVARSADGLNRGTVDAEAIVPAHNQDLKQKMAETIGRLNLSAINEAIRNRLADTPPTDLPDDLTPPIAEAGRGGTYVVRCLYERPRCRPFRDPILSVPSRPFRLASFFDADAPARPLRISLPGAKLSDFRKSPKGVSFLFTSELRKQAQRIQNLTMSDLEEGEIGDPPGVSIGMICSLSIPIITICALILLLVLVFVLNIVFWWLPFFKICFPLPERS